MRFVWRRVWRSPLIKLGTKVQLGLKNTAIIFPEVLSPFSFIYSQYENHTHTFTVLLFVVHSYTLQSDISFAFGNFSQSQSRSLTDKDVIFNLQMTQKSNKGWGPHRWHCCQAWLHLLLWFRKRKEKWTIMDGDAAYIYMTNLYDVLYSSLRYGPC